MKKVILIMFTMGLFVTGFTSCRDTAKDNPVEEAANEVGNEMDQAADEVGNEMDQAADKVSSEVDSLTN